MPRGVSSLLSIAEKSNRIIVVVIDDTDTHTILARFGRYVTVRSQHGEKWSLAINTLRESRDRVLG